MKYKAAWVIAIVIVATIFFLFDPVAAGFPSCPFYAVSGLYCPGCGSQRALHALAHGQVWQALQLNPMIGLALIYFLIEALIAIGRKKGKHWRQLSHRARVPKIILVVVLTFWILRNIPVQPFIWLAP